jgi:hemolysin activation/secretion protein
VGIAAVLRAASPAGPPRPSPAPAASDSDQPTFGIDEFRVLGNTLLDQRSIEGAVYPFLGPHRSLKDVERARDALAALYRKAGFGAVVVDIPEQTVDSGIVRLRVTEGRLQRANISGARYYSETYVLQQLPSLKPGQVLNLNALQLELGQLAQQARDRQITPVLRPGSEPGTVAVDLKVHDTLPLHFSLQVDNRHTSGTTPVRLTGIVSYDNMFQRAETLSLQYTLAPADPAQVELGALTYVGHTPDPRLTWVAYAIRSNSDVAAVGTLSVLGNGEIFGGRLNYALTALPRWSDAISLGVDYKDFRQQVNVKTTGASVTPIHYIIWSADYSANGHWPALDLLSSVALNWGMQGIGNPDTEFEFNRYGARGDFLYLRGSEGLIGHLWHDASIRARLAYQYSEAPLVTNEQFAVGGFDSVRGYLESESLNDTGVLESIELSPPPLKLTGSTSSLFAFYDAGQGGIQQPLPGQISHVNLSSTGFGVRSSWRVGLDFILDGAIALRAGPDTRRDEKRVEFMVKYAH